MFKTTLILLLTLLYSLTSFAEAEQYTCQKISRGDEQVDWSCLEYASDELRYKAQMLSFKLLEQVEKIEKHIGEKQDVYIIARAGSSLAGFDHLRAFDKNDSPITLSEIFDYGRSFMPNGSVDRHDYQTNLHSGNDFANYNSSINKARLKISQKYLDKSYPKLKFSHAGILFRNKNTGGWNLYHELMPCNQKGKALAFPDYADAARSAFFIDKPHKYTGLVLPLKKSLQKRLLHTIFNDQVHLAVGPVYKAMSNPWDADTGNSNSFVLEMIELGLTTPEQYNSMVTTYQEGRDKYRSFISKKQQEYDVRLLTVAQKKEIETKDADYKKICRPDYPIRKQLIKNYTDKGYQPARVVFDPTISLSKKFFSNFFEQLKVTFIPLVGGHIRPSREYYSEHMKLGIGESVTVKSIWDYLERQELIHPKADSSLFVIPELNRNDANRFQSQLVKVILKDKRFADKEKELKTLATIINKM